MLNVLISSIWFIWIPMLWVHSHYKYFISFSAGIIFKYVYRRQILKYKDGIHTERVKLRCLFFTKKIFFIIWISWKLHQQFQLQIGEKIETNSLAELRNDTECCTNHQEASNAVWHVRWSHRGHLLCDVQVLERPSQLCWWIFSIKEW